MIYKHGFCPHALPNTCVVCHQESSRQEVPPTLLRRNSFTPLSSQDQVKRPRLFSVGHPPRLASVPALSTSRFTGAQESEELSESPVSPEPAEIFMWFTTHTDSIKHTTVLIDIWFYLLKRNVHTSSRAVTIHQTHDSVRITIFDPRFGSYHDFFVGGGRKKKKDF